jgi:hypothetical protein
MPSPVPLKPSKGILGIRSYPTSWLTNDFIGRRAKPSLAHQDRDSFIAFAREASHVPRNIVGKPALWVAGDIGVVACDVRLGEDDSLHFRNAKVFALRQVWQCVYWQVTSFEPTGG